MENQNLQMKGQLKADLKFSALEAVLIELIPLPFD